MGRVNALRLFFLLLAVGFIPFGLTSHNGATLLGVAAIVIFIALTIAGAPSRKSQS